MKIAYDNKIFNMQEYGGISRYYNELAKHLNLSDEEVRVYAGLHRNHYIDDLPKVCVKGFKISYPPKTASVLLNFNNIISSKMIRNWQPDIVHRTYYSDSAKIKNVANVITVYDMIHELFPRFFSKNDPTIRYKDLSTTKADHIICISQATKTDLINILSIPENKISVVHLGYHSNNIFQNDEVYNFQHKKKKPFLLFVGSRGGYKNFKVMLKSISISNKLIRDFNIVAFGGGLFSDEEKSYIKELGFSSKQVVNVQGSDEILSNLYRDAELFIYPSLYEGFGLPPLEAMDHSCPVICSNTSSIPEVVGNAALLFNPNDVDNIKHAIEQVVYDAAIKEQLIAAGKKRLEKFSWEKCAADTLNVYRSIL